jgi:hypothetical protein
MTGAAARGPSQKEQAMWVARFASSGTFALLSLTACTGVITGAPQGSNSTAPASTSGGNSSGNGDSVQNVDISKAPALDCSLPDLGDSSLRRITTTQYAHTVRDLLGAAAVSADALFVLAGGAGGGLKTGRYLQRPGVAHNRLLVSIAQLMGLSDVQRFGSTDQGSGGVPGLV